VYDKFSADYDRFVNWPARLATELPFIARALGQAGPLRILDAACGTGMHAIALAQQGHQVIGADISPAMVERARANAAAAGANVRFEVAELGELIPRVGRGFDTVLCLGNSLPHLLTPEALRAALTDFAACLRLGGVLLLQNLNYDRILARRERWLEPQSHWEGEREYLFLRFYDFDPDGLLTFHMMTLRRDGGGPWQQQVVSTRLRPLRRTELTAALEEIGFTEVTCYGDMTGAPFDPNHSPNLIIVAIR